MEMFTQPILLLALAMVLAIGIERILEIMRAVFDYREMLREEKKEEEFKRSNSEKEYNWRNRKWNQETLELRQRIETRLENARDGGAFTSVLTMVCRYLSPATAETGGLMVLSADKVRNTYIKVRFKIYAIILGLLFAYLFSIDIFSLVNELIHQQAPEAGTTDSKALIEGFKLNYEIKLPGWLGIIISGIAMGLGAAPVHKLITALERARSERR